MMIRSFFLATVPALAITHASMAQSFEVQVIEFAKGTKIYDITPEYPSKHDPTLNVEEAARMIQEGKMTLRELKSSRFEKYSQFEYEVSGSFSFTVFTVPNLVDETSVIEWTISPPESSFEVASMVTSLKQITGSQARIRQGPVLGVGDASRVRGRMTVNEPRATDKNIRGVVTTKIVYRLSSEEATNRAKQDLADVALYIAENP